MWTFQAPQTLQQPACLPKPLYHPNRVSSHHHPSATFRPSTSTTATATANNNQLIQSLCKKGSLKQAIQVLSHEPNPTQQTYELLILYCARQSSLSDGLTVHRHLLDDGFDEDPFLATKLINMYAELEAIDHARQVFDEIRNRTNYVWNALFRALTLAGRGEEVLNLYRQMNKSGLPSDRFTYTYVLKACVASESLVSLLQKGREIHAHILRHGAFEALELFREMMLETRDILLPNSVTMVSVLQACASLAALEQGKLIHGYILRKGLDSILPVISALVTMYARCEGKDRGIEVLSVGPVGVSTAGSGGGGKIEREEICLLVFGLVFRWWVEVVRIEMEEMQRKEKGRYRWVLGSQWTSNNGRLGVEGSTISVGEEAGEGI
ncbi:Pentatricopeptide repeat-containing protein crr2, chloroplastic [Sarracenia purpurea var. burkii]